MTTISSGISGGGNWGGMQPQRMEGRGGKPSFSKIDTDSSGGLDKTELQAMLDKGPQGVQGSGSTDELFSKLDSDSDGSVSQTELEKGMKPPGHTDGSSQNGFGRMGMDTQSFASMMASGMGMGGMNAMGGMPPPPPSDTSGGGTSSNSSTSSTDEAQQTLLNLIDSDQSGDVSKTESSSFQDKMKALLEKMQQMGTQQFGSETSSLSLTA